MDDAETAILSAIEENKEEAAARHAAARASKADVKKQFDETKKKRADKLLDDLKGLVADEMPWKSKLDERTWVSEATRRRFRYRYTTWSDGYSHRYDFNDPILHAFLKPVLKAPSKVTRKRLLEIPSEIQTVFDNRVLMDQYIQRMVDFADHPEAQRGLGRRWQNEEFCYSFYHVQNVLGEPLKDPRALKEEDLMGLCIAVKKVVHRQAACDLVLEKLLSKLEGVPFKEEIEQKSWRENEWAYCFNVDYIHDILVEPFLAPTEITDEILVELAEELRTIFERKQEARRKVELLVQYTEWTVLLDEWRWDCKSNTVTFLQMSGRAHNGARRLLAEKFSDLENLTDTAIAELSAEVIQAIEKG